MDASQLAYRPRNTHPTMLHYPCALTVLRRAALPNESFSIHVTARCTTVHIPTIPDRVRVRVSLYLPFGLSLRSQRPNRAWRVRSRPLLSSAIIARQPQIASQPHRRRQQASNRRPPPTHIQPFPQSSPHSSQNSPLPASSLSSSPQKY